MNPGQLAWRCRRGLKELDLPLMAYLKDYYGSASPGERKRFHRLVDEPDDHMWRYFYQSVKPEDPELESIVRKIRREPASHC